MKDMNSLRAQINTIDDQIMALLDQRFTIVKRIGDLKRLNKASVEDNSRETTILDKATAFTHETEIKTIYNTVFTVSKNLQRK